MQVREQRQCADYGNHDSDDGVAGAGLESVAIHTDLLEDHSVVHEQHGIALIELGPAVFGECQLAAGE